MDGAGGTGASSIEYLCGLGGTGGHFGHFRPDFLSFQVGSSKNGSHILVQVSLEGTGTYYFIITSRHESHRAKHGPPRAQPSCPHLMISCPHLSFQHRNNHPSINHHHINQISWKLLVLIIVIYD